MTRRIRSSLQNLVLFGLSSLVALATGELAVRAFVPVRNIGPSFSEPHPSYGKVFKRNFHGRKISPEFTMVLTTDSLGHRGPQPTRFPSRGILFLGDSFTGGYGVNDGEEFPAIIRRTLNSRFGEDRIPVVNAGTGNTGNGYWLKFLKDEGRRYGPRMVVLQYCENDFEDNIQDGMFALGPNGQLRELSPPVKEKALRSVEGVVEAVPGLSYSHLLSLARQVLTERNDHNNESDPVESGSSGSPTAKEQLTYGILRDVLDLCRREGWPVVGLLVGLGGTRKGTIKQIFASSGQPCVAMPLKSEAPQYYFRIDGHWTAAGHARAAELLLPAVLESLALASEQPSGPKR